MMGSMLLLVILLELSGFQQIADAMQTIQVRSGEDAMLQCPLLDSSNATTANPTVSPTPSDPSTISWYRKAAGHGPELLLSFRPADGSNLMFGTGVGPDKVSAAADGSLLLRHSEQSDTAVYYCGISQGSEQKMGLNPQTTQGTNTDPAAFSLGSQNKARGAERDLTPS